MVSTNPNTPAKPISQRPPFRPSIGPHPVVQPGGGQAPAAGFRASPQVTRGSFAPIRIMSNPHRGGRGATNGNACANGRQKSQNSEDTNGVGHPQSETTDQPQADHQANTNGATNPLPPRTNPTSHHHGPPPHRGRPLHVTNGGPPFRGMGRGRGGYGDRGRGFVPRGSPRGRGSQ